MTKPRKITFVHAPDIRYDQNYGTYFTPLWAYTLAAYIPDNWQAEILDTKIDTLDHVAPADVFAFSGINQDIDSIREAHDRIKAQHPDSTFILGGPMTWSLQKEGKLDLLLYFDHVFIMDGEETLPFFLNELDAGRRDQLPGVIEAERFAIGRARAVRFDLMRPKIDHYYGAVVEVSRGCPFLCEFCDIRVLPDNNRSNNKPVDIIIRELDEYFRMGVTQIQFACDNFIGDIAWAKQCVDAIVEWKERTGARISIFTWLTINLYKLPDLMVKMRRAGFSILFIGIESVNQHSLLETAKVQNMNALHQAVKTVQSYGFIIAPGFIFGFDSDTETIFEDTLNFFIEVGMIGGDPSFLTALSGTPLYRRMKQTGRLVERENEVTVRRKIETNIRYLQSTDFLKKGFIDFIRRYTSPSFQFRRFESHLNIIRSEDRFIPIDDVGYGSPIEYLKLQIRDAANTRMLLLRIAYLLRKPSNILAVLKAWLLVKKHARRHPGLNIHFNYWVYVWTNIGLKYWGLKEEDFQIYAIDEHFDLDLLTRNTTSESEEHQRRGNEKVAIQSRYTQQALKQLVESKKHQ